MTPMSTNNTMQSGNNVVDLFRLVIEAARVSRIAYEKDPDLNPLYGRALWGEIKKFLSSGQCIRYVEEPMLSKYDWILNLTEYDVNGNTIESAHFLMQVVRIPRSGENSFVKGMQVALNLGQRAAMHELGTYHGMEDMPSYDPSSYINKDDLDAHISKFLTAEQCSQLYELISTVLNSSN